MLNSVSPNARTYQPQPRALVDGKVDQAALAGLSNKENLVTDIQDVRLETILSDKVKKDGAALGDEWKGSYRSLPVYSNRGIIALDERSDFKTSSQTLEVDWHKKTVTLTTEAPGSEQGHQMQASFDWQRQLLSDSVTESSYLIADKN